MSGAEGGIFISYRRQESSHVAGRLYDRLADLFGTERVFIDVDKIKPGANFAEEIDRAVATSDVLLVTIGPHWLTATDEQGHRRLDNPDDTVRLEIEAALNRNVLVVPILVEGAVMPRRQDLPDSLASLVLRNAHIVRHESFRYDVESLVASLGGIIRPRSHEKPHAGTEQRSWRLEPVASSGNTETVRLSTGNEAHEITYKNKLLAGETITVDGQVAVRRFPLEDQEYALSALSSAVGAGVTIRIEKLSLFSSRHMIFKVGDQVLIHEFRTYRD